jgi:hypothetical protein
MEEPKSLKDVVSGLSEIEVYDEDERFLFSVDKHTSDDISEFIPDKFLEVPVLEIADCEMDDPLQIAIAVKISEV